jgi:hypothetical protein
MEIPFLPVLAEKDVHVEPNGTFRIAFKDPAMFGDEPALALMDFALKLLLHKRRDR